MRSGHSDPLWAFGRSMRRDRREKAEIDLEQTEEAWLSWSGEWMRDQFFALCADIFNRRSQIPMGIIECLQHGVHIIG